MIKNNSLIEVVNCRDRVRTAWREFAAAETFAGRTLAEFEADTQAVVQAREQLDIARSKQSGLIRAREQADKEFRDLLDLVINSVRGNHAYGADSALYRALGYVPRSERASGLTRKRKGEDNANQMSQKENDAA